MTLRTDQPEDPPPEVAPGIYSERLGTARPEAQTEEGSRSAHETARTLITNPKQRI